jgi:hypothetical protein
MRKSWRKKTYLRLAEKSAPNVVDHLRRLNPQGFGDFDEFNDIEPALAALVFADE